jgi:uncharacterized membrane protein
VFRADVNLKDRGRRTLPVSAAGSTKERRKAMAFCSKCGAQLTEGAVFCGTCGASSAPGAGTSTPPPPPGSAGRTSSTTGGMTSNVAGFLTYLVGFVTGIIFLLIEPYKNDRFVRFHAFQSIFFNVALIVVMIVYSIISAILGAISFGILAILMALLFFVIWLGVVAYWIFLMYKAYKGEYYKIPFVGDLAEKQVGM